MFRHEVGVAMKPVTKCEERKSPWEQPLGGRPRHHFILLGTVAGRSTLKTKVGLRGPGDRV